MARGWKKIDRWKIKADGVSRDVDVSLNIGQDQPFHASCSEIGLKISERDILELRKQVQEFCSSFKTHEANWTDWILIRVSAEVADEVCVQIESMVVQLGNDKAGDPVWRWRYEDEHFGTICKGRPGDIGVGMESESIQALVLDNAENRIGIEKLKNGLLKIGEELLQACWPGILEQTLPLLCGGKEFTPHQPWWRDLQRPELPEE